MKNIFTAVKSVSSSASSSDKLVSGITILGISNIITKILGVLYKIPLVRIIGDDGMGYFNAAYTIFTLFYMISTAGLPVAVSILVSQARARGDLVRSRRIFTISLISFIVIGVIGTALMMGLSAPLSDLIGSPLAVRSMLFIAPTLIFVCVSSALRGYFQGHQRMSPTAASQVIEATGKLMFGIIFTLFSLNRGDNIATVASFAALGLSVAEFFSMVYLIITMLRFRSARYYDRELFVPTEHDKAAILSSLFKIALPITISSAMLSVTSLIDLTLVMRRLQGVGYTSELANVLYGNYTGLVLPLFNLPPVLIYPIAYAIVPFISGAVVKGHRERISQTVDLTLKAVSIIALPCSVGLCVLALPILTLMFPAESAVRAAPSLSIIACGILFASLLALSTSTLQALRKVNIPIIAMGCGAIVKIICTYIFVGLYDIRGAAISTVACYAVASGINLFFVCFYTGVKPKILDTLIKPAIAAFFCGVSSFTVYLNLSNLRADWLPFDGRVPNWLATLIAILAGGIVYIGGILLLRALKRDELEFLLKKKRPL